MNALLLALLLFQVGPQLSPGVITGVVREENGLPTPGVRVYAIAVGDGLDAANPGTAMQSLVATDGEGRYRFYLRNLPDEYSIKSITYGSQDLLNGTLKIPPVTTVNIEIRVAHAVKSNP